MRRGRRRCMAGTGSSTSRRCSRRTCRASPPRGLSPRCRRNTCSGASPTAPTTGRGGSARSAPRRVVPFRFARCDESGALVALGSDWPVARFDPRLGLAAARLRRPPGERDRQSVRRPGNRRSRCSRGLHDERSRHRRRAGAARSDSARLCGRPHGLRRRPGRVRSGRVARAAGGAHGGGRRDRPPSRLAEQILHGEVVRACAAGAPRATCSPSDPCPGGSGAGACRGGSGASRACRSAPRRRASGLSGVSSSSPVPQRFGSLKRRSLFLSTQRQHLARRSRPGSSRRPRPSRRSRGARPCRRGRAGASRSSRGRPSSSGSRLPRSPPSCAA